MISMRHECLVDLFKNRPSLAAELLAEVLGVVLPPYAEARVVSVDLTETQPAEYRADVVVLLLRDDRPVRVIIVEVQLRKDADKPYTWPAYLVVARDQYRCPADLLIIAPDPTVAQWCAQPIEIGVRGFVLTPPVLRREEIPVVTDPVEAARRVELGVLSAMAYGESEVAATIAAAVVPAIQGLDDERARFYYDLVYNSLHEAARRSLDAMMKGHEYQSDFARKYVAQGRDEGRTEATAHAVLTALRVRGLAVTEATRDRILAQKDPEHLERWLEKAILATSLAEVLDEPS